MKNTLYTITFSDGAVHNVTALGAIQAIILAQAGRVKNGEDWTVETVQNNDDGNVYAISNPQLTALPRKA